MGGNCIRNPEWYVPDQRGRFAHCWDPSTEKIPGIHCKRRTLFTKMSDSACRLVNSGSQCVFLGATSNCRSCVYDEGTTFCNGYPMLKCQMPPSYSAASFDAAIPWMFMTGTFDDIVVGQNVTFSSNRDFAVSAVQFMEGQYVNNFTFSSTAGTTDLSWAWVEEPQYMYFNYPNMSVEPQPFAFPSQRPSNAPRASPTHYPSHGPDDDDDLCSDTPCPTHCANGYTSSYTNSGCTVYCKDMPVGGQCLPGGSGCDSSCRDISIGAIIGIAVGGFVFLGLVIGAIVYFTCCRGRTPMTQRENEVSNPL